MVLLSFFGSIEFYVIMAVVAAAVVALVSRPQSRGEVTEHLIASRLIQSDGSDASQQPSLVFTCLDSGEVRLQRKGIEGVTMSGAVSIAAKFDGVNLTIEERIIPGNKYDILAVEAVFFLDFLRPGRYHVRYNSDSSGLFAAFQLHVRPGIVAERQLSR